jgi:MoaA/NifB/PqqE/SkfB family radical SAM enzyme
MRETRADVAVISEGEITILEVMDAFTRGNWSWRLAEIKGIWYRDSKGQVHATPPRGQMPNLDSLPNMRLDLWPQFKDPRGMQPQIIASYSRGCKMDCSFCYRTTPQERVKSPQKLNEELAFLKKNYQTEFIFFVDLTFTAHKKQTLEYLDVIGQHDIGWTCLTRNADVDLEVTTRMGETGCDIGLFGVETLTPEVLKEARKGSTENLVFRAMRNAEEGGIRYGGLTIVGLPGETEESLDHMCGWAEEHNHITRVKYLSAMPGTTVYRQGLESGVIRSEVEHLRWLSVEQALERDEFLNYNGLPDAVMRRAYKRIYDSYCPGPVMDFKHYPEHFAYFDPDPNPAKPWRANFASAGAHPFPGSEEFRGQRARGSPSRTWSPASSTRRSEAPAPSAGGDRDAEEHSVDDLPVPLLHAVEREEGRAALRIDLPDGLAGAVLDGLVVRPGVDVFDAHVVPHLHVLGAGVAQARGERRAGVEIAAGRVSEAEHLEVLAGVLLAIGAEVDDDHATPGLDHPEHLAEGGEVVHELAALPADHRVKGRLGEGQALGGRLDEDIDVRPSLLEHRRGDVQARDVGHPASEGARDEAGAHRDVQQPVGRGRGHRRDRGLGEGGVGAPTAGAVIVAGPLGEVLQDSVEGRGRGVGGAHRGLGLVAEKMHQRHWSRM